MALPNQIDNSDPDGSEVPSYLVTAITGFKTAVQDILGVPDATNISNAVMTVGANGLTNLIHRNSATDPTAAGELQRNAADLKLHDGTAARTFYAIGTNDVAAADGGTGSNTAAATGIPSISAGTWATNATLPTTLGGFAADTSANTGVPIVSSGTWSVPSTLAIAQGGTGLTAAPANGGVLIGNAGNYANATLTAANAVLITNAAGAITLDRGPILDRDVTSFTNVASTVEVTAYTYTVPANTLSTNRMLRVHIMGNCQNVDATHAGSWTSRWRLKFGGTVIFDYTFTQTNHATLFYHQTVNLDSYISAANSATAQIAGTLCTSVVSSTLQAICSTFTPTEISVVHNGLTVDTTTAQDLVLTVSDSSPIPLRWRASVSAIQTEWV